MRSARRRVASSATVPASGAALVAGVPGTGSAAENAPGAPGRQPATWAPANKQGFRQRRTRLTRPGHPCPARTAQG